MDLHRHLRSLALLIFILATYFSTALTRHSRLRHSRHRHKRQDTYHKGNFVMDGDGSSDWGDWGAWSEASECSRTCGGGVASQTRFCSSMSPDGAELCRGGHRRYFSCNIQDCPGSENDFRSEQCAEFNTEPFEDRYYDWVPYTKAPNKCELNCMPRGERFYYRHRRKVVDGTRCEEEKLDVCVDGKCLPVGCDKKLGSSTREDRCRECGGDGSSCTPVSGLLQDSNLQVGYNDLLLIPAGATNIRIQEVEASSNYLAIRNESGHYYLNGNWRIDFSRSLKFAGAIFHYDRKPHGFFAPDQITSLGPTTEPIFVVLLYQGVNPGVQYEYSISKGVSHQTDPDSYTWISGDFSECSSTCGGGSQTRKVTCIRRRNAEDVDSHLCDPAREPANNQTCNTDPCPAGWTVNEWGPCSESCGEGGFQLRQVHCEKIVANSLPSVVDDEECIELVGPKPSTKEMCIEGTECPQWHTGPWRPCDHLCGDGEHRRQVRCFLKVDGKVEVLPDSACSTEKPDDTKPCMLRPCEGVDWVTSDWSGCDDKCGLTQETRKVFCANLEGKVYPDEMCDKKSVPELVRDCESSVNCEFQWFAAQWSKCSAQCGSGVKTRKVFCGTFGLDGESTIMKVEDEKCDLEEKYEDTKNCSAQVECTGQWFSGPWGVCSKACGGGDMSRKVICMKDNETVSATNCSPGTIPFSSEGCNPQQCGPDEIMPVEPMKIVDEEAECEEEEDGTFITMETTLGLDESSVTSGPQETDEGSGDTDFTSGITEEFLPSTSVDQLSSFSSSSMGTQSSDGLTDMSHSSDSITASSPITLDLMLSDATYETSDTDSSLTTTSEDLVTTSSSSDSSSVDPGMSATTVGVSDGSSSETASPSDVSPISTDSSSTDVESTTDSSKDSSESSSPLPDTSTSDLSSSSSDVETTTSSIDISSSSVSESDSTMSSDSSSPTDDTTTDMSSTSSATESTVSETLSSDFTSSESPSSSDVTTETSVTTTLQTDTDTDIPIPDVEEGDYIDLQVPKLSSGIFTTMSTVSSDLSSDSSSTLKLDISSSTEDSSTDVSESSTVSGDVSGTTSSGESEVTTVSGESTVTTMTPESYLTTVSGDSAMTTVSGGSAMTTESSLGDTTVSGESGATTVAGDTYTTTTSGASADTLQTDEFMVETSQSPIELAITKEQKIKKCKPKKKPDVKKCEVSEFGCCPDGVREAEGPFSKGCPVPMTCNETDHGCCPDGVSPAQGPKGKDCPPSHCEETLFGCCQDGVSIAEGNDFEGCKVEDDFVPFKCETTEFGCCPDNMTAASGPKYVGCFECEGSGECDSCNDTTFGCCEDGLRAARGPNFAGCEEEEGSGEGSTTTEGVAEYCGDSPHGCCPDGKSTATGPNFEGCDVINYENCTLSYFGCCHSGENPALGPNFEGCQMPCENETFGCCRDGSTPAHGPNMEGCCLSSSYGCCPDNILAAQGPNLEGCGCQYARFGCCPDNTTAARGPNNEGCGCQHTTFGCCPNQYTPAAGPNFQGCPCHTYQFGCCPDGITAAQGPHSQGCGCDRSEFGCCSDGRTQALGPDGAGCLCDSSKYGCCPNGVTEAQGEKFEGCTQLPTIPGEVCTLSKERGSCREFSVKWFFDMEYGGCSRFWYGGCEGNGNRFNSADECKNSCVEAPGKDACYLPKISGPCEGYYPTWYYDQERKQCGQFIYGGCLGNNNRFQTFEACQELCVTPETAEQDICLLPALAGECQNYTERWYYDSFQVRCTPFYYGGCGGNHNNFPTMQACQQRCEGGFATQPPPEEVFRDEYCFLPSDQGTCDNLTVQWFYDSRDGVCKQFRYGGCQGNENRFNAKDECDQKCGRVQDLCTLPLVVGPCSSNYRQWYYNRETDSCEEFGYSGCQGNTNRFSDRRQCEEQCRRSPPPIPPRPDDLQTQGPPPDASLPSEICRESVDPGPCNGNHAAWFYDVETRYCQAFIFGGCGGNANRFYSQEQCERQCGNFVGEDVCSMPHDSGPCDNTVRKWFFDPYSNTCQEFGYGGCEGNGNRFSSKDECASVCLLREEPLPSGNATSLSHGDNEIDVDSHPQKPEPTCQAAQEECSRLLCEYGFERRMDANNCERCQCYNPCRNQLCPEGTRCAIDLAYNQQTGATDYIGVCRQESKPGDCPAVSSVNCVSECYTDADCTGEKKCCLHHCGSACLAPVDTDRRPTYAPPVDSSHSVGREEPPRIVVTEPEVQAEEGHYATLHCTATGNPAPTITWKKGSSLIDGSGGKHKLFEGSLQIIGLDRNDTGIYTCTADNGIGRPAQRDIRLDVTVPVSANITADTTTYPVRSDISVLCAVDGYPIPNVGWFKDGQRLEPNERIQISESHRLLILRASSSDAGTYQCQASNQYESKSSSISINVQGVYIHPNCTDNPFFANCQLIVNAHYCTHTYYARFCCLSCTQAGQLPSQGPHLQRTGTTQEGSSRSK